MKFNFDIFLKKESEKQYFKLLWEYLDKCNSFYPSRKNIYFAMQDFDFDDLKIIIIGQDPYPTKDVADGLCFSTKSTKTPKSLQNIFKSIKQSYPNTNFQTNSLINWKKQGILLLNSILTVEEGKPLSHENIGWDIFTQNLLLELNKKYTNIIYLILGNKAKKFIKNLNLENQIVFMTSHPSPLSYKRGFSTSNIFKKANEKLLSINKKAIDWSTI